LPTDLEPQHPALSAGDPSDSRLCIRVGVDGTDAGTLALRWAVDEGELRHGIVTSVTTVAGPGPTHSWGDATVVAVGPGSGPRPDVTGATPFEALTDGLRSTDLLVLGRAEPPPWERHQLSPFTRRVLDVAPCPVALVGHPGTPHGPTGRERVVAAVEDADDLQPLRWAIDEARLRHAELEVIHVWEPIPDHLSPGAAGFTPLVLERAAERVAADAVACCATDDLDVPPIHRGAVGPLADALAAVAHHASVLVVGSGGLRRSPDARASVPCPVVVVPRLRSGAHHLGER
jgi:nucleotide-binding universal stress UspA family protein